MYYVQILNFLSGCCSDGQDIRAISQLLEWHGMFAALGLLVVVVPGLSHPPDE